MSEHACSSPCDGPPARRFDLIYLNNYDADTGSGRLSRRYWGW